MNIDESIKPKNEAEMNDDQKDAELLSCQRDETKINRRENDGHFDVLSKLMLKDELTIDDLKTIQVVMDNSTGGRTLRGQGCTGQVSSVEENPQTEPKITFVEPQKRDKSSNVLNINLPSLLDGGKKVEQFEVPLGDDDETVIQITVEVTDGEDNVAPVEVDVDATIKNLQDNMTRLEQMKWFDRKLTDICSHMKGLVAELNQDVAKLSNARKSILSHPDAVKTIDALRVENRLLKDAVEAAVKNKTKSGDLLKESEHTQTTQTISNDSRSKHPEDKKREKRKSGESAKKNKSQPIELHPSSIDALRRSLSEERTPDTVSGGSTKTDYTSTQVIEISPKKWKSPKDKVKITSLKRKPREILESSSESIPKHSSSNIYETLDAKSNLKSTTISESASSDSSIRDQIGTKDQVEETIPEILKPSSGSLGNIVEFNAVAEPSVKSEKLPEGFVVNEVEPPLAASLPIVEIPNAEWKQIPEMESGGITVNPLKKSEGVTPPNLYLSFPLSKSPPEIEQGAQNQLTSPRLMYLESPKVVQRDVWSPIYLSFPQPEDAARNELKVPHNVTAPELTQKENVESDKNLLNVAGEIKPMKPTENEIEKITEKEPVNVTQTEPKKSDEKKAEIPIANSTVPVETVKNASDKTTPPKTAQDSKVSQSVATGKASKVDENLSDKASCFPKRKKTKTTSQNKSDSKVTSKSSPKKSPGGNAFSRWRAKFKPRKTKPNKNVERAAADENPENQDVAKTDKVSKKKTDLPGLGPPPIVASKKARGILKRGSRKSKSNASKKSISRVSKKSSKKSNEINLKNSNNIEKKPPKVRLLSVPESSKTRSTESHKIRGETPDKNLATSQEQKAPKEISKKLSYHSMKANKALYPKAIRSEQPVTLENLSKELRKTEQGAGAKQISKKGASKKKSKNGKKLFWRGKKSTNKNSKVSKPAVSKSKPAKETKKSKDKRTESKPEDKPELEVETQTAKASIASSSIGEDKKLDGYQQQPTPKAAPAPRNSLNTSSPLMSIEPVKSDTLESLENALKRLDEPQRDATKTSTGVLEKTKSLSQVNKIAARPSDEKTNTIQRTTELQKQTTNGDNEDRVGPNPKVSTASKQTHEPKA